MKIRISDHDVMRLMLEDPDDELAFDAKFMPWQVVEIPKSLYEAYVLHERASERLHDQLTPFMDTARKAERRARDEVHETYS